MATVRLDGPSGEELSGDHDAFSRAWHAIAVMTAAESVGLGQRAMEMAVAYAKDRTQFERPIGTYQAVSHACAQMLLEVEGARSAVLWAAWALDNEPETAGIADPRREGLRLRLRRARHRVLAPGPWRHRLHLGARPALLPQARAGQRPRLRRRPLAPRRARRGAVPTSRLGHLPHGRLDAVAAARRARRRGAPTRSGRRGCPRRSRRPSPEPGRRAIPAPLGPQRVAVGGGAEQLCAEVRHAGEDLGPVRAHLLAPVNARSGCAGCPLS